MNIENKSFSFETPSWKLQIPYTSILLKCNTAQWFRFLANANQGNIQDER